MKKFLPIVFCFALPFAVKAQPTFYSSDILTTIGTEFIINNINAPNPGDAGLDVIWDFTTINPHANQNGIVAEEGGDTPYLDFSAANYFLNYNNGEAFEYFGVTDTTFDYYGAFQEYAVEMVYSDPMTYLRFPMDLGDEFSDNYVANYTIQQVITGETVGSSHVVVDGYGLLKLPWGEMNAYRVTSQISQTEVFTNPNGTFEGFFEGTSTIWVVPGFPIPAMAILSGTASIPSLSITEQQSSATFIGNFEFVGLTDKEIVSDLNVFPNPATTKMNISFTKQSSEAVDIALYDVRGRKLKNISKAGQGAGFFEQQIDVSDLPAGFYLLKLHSEKGEQGLKVIVK